MLDPWPPLNLSLSGAAAARTQGARCRAASGGGGGEGQGMRGPGKQRQEEGDREADAEAGADRGGGGGAGGCCYWRGCGAGGRDSSGAELERRPLHQCWRQRRRWQQCWRQRQLSCAFSGSVRAAGAWVIVCRADGDVRAGRSTAFLSGSWGSGAAFLFRDLGERYSPPCMDLG